jgi:hypothetical protein
MRLLKENIEGMSLDDCRQMIFAISRLVSTNNPIKSLLPAIEQIIELAEIVVPPMHAFVSMVLNLTGCEKVIMITLPES